MYRPYSWERFKQDFSTRWKFTYLEFSTCSTCLHQKKSYVVVRIIDLLMTLMTSVRGVHYIRTVTPILGHGSVKVTSQIFWAKWSGKANIKSWTLKLLSTVLRISRWNPMEILISYDVSALFTSIPVDSALEAVKIALEEDDSWKEITDLTADQVLQLLDFCLSTTYSSENNFINNVGAVIWAARSARLSQICIWNILKRLHWAHHR